MSDLRIEDLSYFHGKGTPYEIKALDEIALHIREGRTTGIIGHTGSGKSTLVQMFNGILKPHSGRVLLAGEDIWKKPKDIRKVRFKVGLVMQYPEYQLFEETVEKDIAFGPLNMGLDEGEVSKRIRDAISFVGLEPSILQKNPFDLSGGEKRRVAIAGIIAMSPDVLVLDEPAAGLDPQGRDAILDGVLRYKEKTGATVIIVSHSMEDMARLCDNIVVLSGGEVVLSGTRDEVFSESEKLQSIGLAIPQITQLMHTLSAMGISVNTGIYTEEAAISEITSLFEKGRS